MTGRWPRRERGLACPRTHRGHMKLPVVTLLRWAEKGRIGWYAAATNTMDGALPVHTVGTHR